jgi:hypothetical protein
MKAHEYEVTEAVAGFEEGDVLDVTARFGDWHTYQLKLEPSPTDSPYDDRTVVVTSEAGFTESEILDETARIGDWHEADLQFDPAASPERAETGRVRLTADEFERVTRPVGATA